MLTSLMGHLDTEFPTQSHLSLVAPSTGAELLSAAAAGDQAALSELYDSHSQMVFGMAFRILGDHARAEEVTQDVFLAVWNRGASFNPGRGSARAWLGTCARNRAIDMVRGGRASAARREADLPPSLADSTDVHHEVAGKIDAQVVRKALGALSPDQRMVIELCYFKARTQLEAAIEIGVPLSTIKGRCRLALERLAGLLDGSLNWSLG